MEFGEFFFCLTKTKKTKKPPARLFAVENDFKEKKKKVNDPILKYLLKHFTTQISLSLSLK